MQVYAGVETLTNQPSAAERAEVPHHLVGYLPLTETSSVGAHAPLAHAAIDAAAERGALPLVVGGTGLYLRAALADLALPPAVPRAERARWERVLRRARRRRPRSPSSRAATRARPERLHANDRRRVVRALELAAAGREPGAASSDRLWGGGMRRPARRRGRVVAARGAARAHRGRAPRRCSPAERSTRCARCATRGVEPSPTAARILGLAQIGAYLDGQRDARRGRRRDHAAHRASTRAGRRPGRVGSPRPSSSQAPTARSATPTACWS